MVSLVKICKLLYVSGYLIRFSNEENKTEESLHTSQLLFQELCINRNTTEKRVWLEIIQEGNSKSI